MNRDDEEKTHLDRVILRVDRVARNKRLNSLSELRILYHRTDGRNSHQNTTHKSIASNCFDLISHLFNSVLVVEPFHGFSVATLLFIFALFHTVLISPICFLQLVG